MLPYASGLPRNIMQCLRDYHISLHLSTTLAYIYGPNGRLVGVTVAKVDEKCKPIKGTEEFVECDTLLLSVALIPENELTREQRRPSAAKTWAQTSTTAACAAFNRRRSIKDPCRN